MFQISHANTSIILLDNGLLMDVISCGNAQNNLQNLTPLILYQQMNMTKNVYDYSGDQCKFQLNVINPI